MSSGQPTRRAGWWLLLSIAAALTGTAGLVIGAQQLGEVLYLQAAPSWTALALPLAIGALLETVSVAAGGMAGVELSLLFRRRTLDHALGIDPDRSEALGSGAALARALDADLVGSFLVTTAPAAILGLIELTVGAAISSRAPDGGVRLGVVAVSAAALLLTWRVLVRARRRWTESRELMTADLVERLIGQRTVALQERAATQRSQARTVMRLYDQRSRRLDSVTLLVSVVVLGTGSALVILALQLRSSFTGADVASAIAAALLVSSGLLRLGRVVDDVAGVQVAREQVAKLAAMRTTPPPPAAVPAGGALIRACGVVGGYSDGRPVVGPVDVTLMSGDLLLITGPSGSGKTTLVELLDGRRAASSGTVERTASVARVPQAGDDHLLHASLLFNVLMGLAWPPELQHVADAEEVLTDLGLGPLIDRMPAGILQPIGDGGWRLSAGESARVRLARALVRRPEVLILDETFAPLDAATFQLSLHTAQKWARSLIVIAHP